MGEPTVAEAANQKPAKGKPLYRQLSDALREEITGGSYAIGSLLPTEQDLCDRFQTSRYTVREALRLLTADGLIVRRQGRGSEVASQLKRPAYAQSLTSLSELYSYAEDTQLVIDHVDTVVPDDAMALELGRKSGRAWLTAEGTRRAPGGAIICASRIFINTEFQDIESELTTINGAIHVAIAARFAVDTDQVRQNTTMVKAGKDVAKSLDLEPGDWTVQVRRRYLASDSRPILVSFNWHRPEDFSYTQIIRRD